MKRGLHILHGLAASLCPSWPTQKERGVRYAHRGHACKNAPVLSLEGQSWCAEGACKHPYSTACTFTGACMHTFCVPGSSSASLRRHHVQAAYAPATATPNNPIPTSDDDDDFCCFELLRRFVSSLLMSSSCSDCSAGRLSSVAFNFSFRAILWSGAVLTRTVQKCWVCKCNWCWGRATHKGV